MRKVFLLLVMFITTNVLHCQESGTVLILVNIDSEILVDGELVGNVQKMIPKKFDIEKGKHYVQAINNELSLNSGKFLEVQPGKQEILEINFEIETEIGPIDICNQKVTVPGSATVGIWLSEHPNMSYPDYPRFYFIFEKGDIIVINCNVIDAKGTNNLNIYNYPDYSLAYTGSSFRELKNERIKVEKRQIFIFEITTNHLLQRDCNINIARIPSDESTCKFITKVELHESYNPVTIVKSQKNYINSGSNATFIGGKSRITIPVSLPGNTVKWYYKISAFRDDEAIDQSEDIADLASEIAGLLDISGGLLTFGINQFTKPPGNDYCDVYLLDHNNSILFTNKDQFQYFTQGTRENIESGVVDIDCCNTGNYFLGIKNPDSYTGINTTIEVVAIVKESELKQVE